MGTGTAVGTGDVGPKVGTKVGPGLGIRVGDAEGSPLGIPVGTGVGNCDGTGVGCAVGTADGCRVSIAVVMPDTPVTEAHVDVFEYAAMDARRLVLSFFNDVNCELMVLNSSSPEL